MTPETLSEIKSLLQKTIVREDFGMDLNYFLRTYALDLIKAVKQRDRYRTALEKAQDCLDEARDYHTADSREILLLRAIHEIDNALKDTKEVRNDP